MGNVPAQDPQHIVHRDELRPVRPDHDQHAVIAIDSRCSFSGQAGRRIAHGDAMKMSLQRAQLAIVFLFPGDQPCGELFEYLRQRVIEAVAVGRSQIGIEHEGKRVTEQIPHLPGSRRKARIRGGRGQAIVRSVERDGHILDHGCRAARSAMNDPQRSCEQPAKAAFLAHYGCSISFKVTSDRVDPSFGLGNSRCDVTPCKQAFISGLTSLSTSTHSARPFALTVMASA